MVSVFSEAGVDVPENWREIGEQLGLHLRGKLSAAEFFKGWQDKDLTNNKPSWKKLAQALEKMEDYRHVAVVARNKARKNKEVEVLQLTLQSLR